MNNRTDLNLGEFVYILIIFHIPVSCLNLVNGYEFYFIFDRVTLQTIHRHDCFAGKKRFS